MGHTSALQDLIIQCSHAHYRFPGVQLKSGAILAADLVIDASGRRSKVQTWLEEGGYSAPMTFEVDPGVGYSSAIFEVPPEVRLQTVLWVLGLNVNPHVLRNLTRPGGPMAEALNSSCRLFMERFRA